jgi:hypothetical protein
MNSVMRKSSVWRYAAVIAVAFLVAAGCGDKKASTSSKKSPAPTTAATASPPPAPAAAAASPARSAAQGRSAPAAAPGAPLQSGSLQPTAPGNYSFNESGEATINCGTPQTQPAPSPTSLKVDAANGNRQRSTRDRRRSNGQGIVIIQDFEFRPDGFYLAYMHQQQSTPIGNDTSEFEPNPPVLAMPRSPKGGQSWQFSLSSKDGRIKVDVSNTVEAVEEPVTLANGSTAPASRVKSTRHATGQSNLGAIDITENTTLWVSLRDRLIVKQISDTNGTVGVCTTNSHIEELISSTTPS